MSPFTTSLASARMLLASMAVLAVVDAIGAVPPGFRYIGSRTVSAGRVVLWYWNPDIVEAADSPTSFAARLFARAVDVDQERPYVAIVRCNDRTYRPASETGPFLPIDDGEPIAAVWRAGCMNGVAVSALERRARLDGNIPGAATGAVVARAPEGSAVSPARVAAPVAASSPPAAVATTPAAVVAAPAAPSAPAAATAAGSTPTGDPRRVDACVRFSDARSTPAGDAAITNICTHPVEVSLCYKGADGGRQDCGTPVRGRLSDSLGPGVMHVLPEYRRGRHRGIAVVACRGSPGMVFPRLEEPGRSGCN